MKNGFLRVGFMGVLLLLAVPRLVAMGRGDERLPAQPSQSQLKPESLALPSFAIFGFTELKENEKVLERPYSAKELEEILKATEKNSSDAKKVKVRDLKLDGYWIIPMVIYRSRDLFADQDWTKQDMEEGQRLGDFFARLVKRPDLNIDVSTPETFRAGLLKLKNWFAALCRDNKTLSAMIFTFDDGPFLGQSVNKKQLDKAKRVASMPIGNTGAKFVLMTDQKKPEPLIIGVLNAKGALLWARRYSGEEVGTISEATLIPKATKKLAGYGYKCGISAGWTYGHEYSAIYLDEQLNLRFYYVSW